MNRPKLAHVTSKFRADVVEVVSLDGGVGVVRYRADDGSEGNLQVVAEGWGDGYPSYWPPALGDVIDVRPSLPIVVMALRPRR